MPTCKGIKISVVSQCSIEPLPEYAYPESSQSPVRRRHSFYRTKWTPLSTSLHGKVDRVLGRPSAVSVYIPSLPGMRLWLQFNILEAAALHCEWYYFKIFMNGRHITSRGINSKKDPQGQIVHGLFQSNQEGNSQFDGIECKNKGTEERPFCFPNKEESRSVANDGGLIEVMVYRARSRKRAAPDPVEYKEQAGDGNIMPTRGVLKKPHEARNFNWYLKDSKDDPFSVFKFHYRTWETLTSLQVIPAGHERPLIPATPSQLSLSSLSEDKHGTSQWSKSAVHNSRSPGNSSDASSEIPGTPWMTSVFDNSPENSPKKRENKEAFVVPPKRIPSNFDIQSPSASASKSNATTPEKVKALTRKLHLYKGGRPLPGIPPHISSPKHSIISSTTSNAVSITPSLVSYFNRESLSPEHEIGVASIVQFKAYPKPIIDSHLSASGKQCCLSNEATVLDEPSDSSHLLEQKSRRLSTASLTLLLPKFSIPKRGVSFKQRKISKSEQQFLLADKEKDQIGMFSLSESEWMCRSPLPVRNNPEPRVRRKSSQQIMKGSIPLRKRAMTWFGRIKGIEEAPEVKSMREALEDE